MSPQVEMLYNLSKLIRHQQTSGDGFSQEEMMCLWQAYQNIIDFWDLILQYDEDDKIH
tara:strand:+ start:1448 stop:1621 length:174 start_codon:yes stop_codon:yes gene_type:complete